MEQLLDRPAALGALLDVGIGEFLNLLEAVVALLTLIFVNWHGASERDTTLSGF
jgi:hypothetical protein